MVNVIFLDFDGVMIPGRIWAMNRAITGYGLMLTFDPVAVHQLNEIYKELDGNLKIVVSSSQQSKYEYLSMSAMFRTQGLKVPLAEMWRTGHRGSDARHLVISEFISDHKIENYAVLDDIDMTSTFKDRMVWTDYNDGLLTSHFDHIRKIFGINKPLVLI